MGYSNPLMGLGGSAGDAASWPQGMSQPTQEVTDLSPHVDGGPASARGTVNGSGVGVQPAYDAAMVIAAALVLLWVLGGFSLRQHNL